MKLNDMLAYATKPAPFDPKTRNREAFEIGSGQTITAAAILEFQAALTTNMVDTSKWNSPFDWPLFATWGVGGYHKATEGIWTVDVLGQANFVTSRQANLLSVLYHFFRSNVTGTAQANYFLNQTISSRAAVGGKLAVILDVETVDGTSNAVRVQRITEFANVIHAAGGVIGLYTASALTPTLGLNTVAMNNLFDFFALAHWTGGPMMIPANWNPAKISIHQYGIWNDHPWIPAVVGGAPDVDVNRLLCPVADFAALIGQGTPITPPPPDPVPAPPFPFSAQVVNVGSYLNLRTTPKTSGQDIGNLPLGRTLTVWDEFIIIPGSDEWWLVVDEAQGNLAGWAAHISAGVTYLQVAP